MKISSNLIFRVFWRKFPPQYFLLNRLKSTDLTYIWNGMFGILLRISFKRSHGHSCKNRNATSNVAPVNEIDSTFHRPELKSPFFSFHLPPQFSSAYKLLNLCATNGEIFSRSWVRTRVANSDWWASRNVVSISKSSLRPRTALANASGPSFTRMSRSPFGGSVTVLFATASDTEAGERKYFVKLHVQDCFGGLERVLFEWRTQWILEAHFWWKKWSIFFDLTILSDFCIIIEN